MGVLCKGDFYFFSILWVVNATLPLVDMSVFHLNIRATHMRNPHTFTDLQNAEG